MNAAVGSMPGGMGGAEAAFHQGPLLRRWTKRAAAAHCHVVCCQRLEQLASADEHLRGSWYLESVEVNHSEVCCSAVGSAAAGCSSSMSAVLVVGV